MKNQIPSNPWVAAKLGPPYVAILVGLWSEQNEVKDILKISRRLQFMSSAGWILAWISAASLLAFVMGKWGEPLETILMGGGLLVAFASAVLIIIGDPLNQQCIRCTNDIRELLHSMAWKWIEGTNPEILTDVYLMRNKCDEWMTRKCIEILACQANGNPKRATNCKEELCAQSTVLNNFSSLGTDWKVYFAAASERMGGNDWVI